MVGVFSWVLSQNFTINLKYFNGTSKTNHTLDPNCKLQSAQLSTSANLVDLLDYNAIETIPIIQKKSKQRLIGQVVVNDLAKKSYRSSSINFQ